MSLELPAMAGVMSSAGSIEAGTVKVRFSGTADLEARADLERYMNKLHDEAVRLTASKVVIDLRELEFMNSSCFKIFVSWLAKVRDLTPAQQYRIDLLSNPSLLWQRRSLAALSCFAVDLVKIET